MNAVNKIKQIINEAIEEAINDMQIDGSTAKIVNLTPEQKEKVFNGLCQIELQPNDTSMPNYRFFLEIDIDENAWVQVEGDLYMKGYVERDTNAFVETYRQVFDLSVKVCWNDDEDEYHEADVPKDFIKECKNFIEANADFY